jgi:hypothetical protein
VDCSSDLGHEPCPCLLVFSNGKSPEMCCLFYSPSVKSKSLVQHEGQKAATSFHDPKESSDAIPQGCQARAEWIVDLDGGYRWYIPEIWDPKLTKCWQVLAKCQTKISSWHPGVTRILVMSSHNIMQPFHNASVVIGFSCHQELAIFFLYLSTNWQN